MLVDIISVLCYRKKSGKRLLKPYKSLERDSKKKNPFVPFLINPFVPNGMVRPYQMDKWMNLYVNYGVSGEIY